MSSDMKIVGSLATWLEGAMWVGKKKYWFIRVFCVFWSDFAKFRYIFGLTWLCLKNFGKLLMFLLKLHIRSGGQVPRKQYGIFRSGVEKIGKRISCWFVEIFKNVFRDSCTTKIRGSFWYNKQTKNNTTENIRFLFLLKIICATPVQR